MRGFTLIELIAVLVVVGVLVAAATVKFTSSTSAISVRAAAEMIQADIRYTQAEAMAINAARSINFSGGNNYMVGSETRDLPSGVTIAAGRLFTFDSLGEPTAGGGQFVSVSDGTNTNTVTVVDYTGKVSIS